MKKLRRISLEDFDRLTSSEASKIIGGYDNPTIPPVKGTGTGTTQPIIYDPPVIRTTTTIPVVVKF